jgi:hypothetical protein
MNTFLQCSISLLDEHSLFNLALTCKNIHSIIESKYLKYRRIRNILTIDGDYYFHNEIFDGNKCKYIMMKRYMIEYSEFVKGTKPDYVKCIELYVDAFNNNTIYPGETIYYTVNLASQDEIIADIYTGAWYIQTNRNGLAKIIYLNPLKCGRKFGFIQRPQDHKCRIKHSKDTTQQNYRYTFNKTDYIFGIAISKNKK